LFLEYGNPVNFSNNRGSTLLFSATLRLYEKEAMVQMLLGMGARANVRTDCGETPWTYPVAHGWVEVVDLLLLHGADVNFTDGEGQTPLHMALTRNSREPQDKWVYPFKNRIAWRLLQNGTKVNIPDCLGNTALHLAAGLGIWSLLRSILEAYKISNSPIDPMNWLGDTPLDLCKSDSTISKFRAWAEENGSK
jgi:ankyrin repeat protein